MQNHPLESTAPFNPTTFHIPCRWDNTVTHANTSWVCPNFVNWTDTRHVHSELPQLKWPIRTLTTALCLLHVNHYHSLFTEICIMLIILGANVQVAIHLGTPDTRLHKACQNSTEVQLLTTIVCNECSHTNLLQITVISIQLGSWFVPCRDMSKLTFHKCFTNTPKTAHLT